MLEQSVPDGPPEKIIEHSKGPLKGGVEFAGSHRLDGVFVIAGGPARRGHVFSGAEIIDVAPTIFYLMGLPVPAAMDGRPLLEAIDPAFVADHPPTYEAPSEAAYEAAAADKPFTAEEEELIARRLRSMGYLE